MNERSLSFLRWGARRQRSVGNRAQTREKRLTSDIVGLSYGTFLGTTYANLFPDRVRAVVLDGSIDPVEWTTGHDDQADLVPTGTRLGSHVSASQTLGEFLRLCADAGPAQCPFAVGTDRQATADRFVSLMDRLRAHPVLVPTPGGPVPLTYADVVTSVLGALYRQLAWSPLAAILQQLDQGSGPLLSRLVPPPATTYIQKSPALPAA